MAIIQRLGAALNLNVQVHALVGQSSAQCEPQSGRLKENVTMGRLIREIEYAFDTDEPMLGRPPAGDVE